MSTKKTVHIHIDTRTFVRFLVVLSLFVGTVFLIWKLQTALLIILVSFFLAVALNAPVSALAKKLPGKNENNRIKATALSYVVVLSILAFFLYIAVPAMIEQSIKLLNSLPQYVADISSDQGWLGAVIDRYNLDSQVNQLIAGIQQQSANIAENIGSSLVVGISSLITALVTLITVLVLTFFMLAEGPKWVHSLWLLYEDEEKRENHKRIVHKMYKVVTGFVNGQVVIASIAATVSLVLLMILAYFFDVPFSVVVPLVGLIFITDMIPMIGATFGAVVAIIVLLFSDPVAALIFATYYVIYQQVENNFIQPVVQSKKVSVTALSVFIAVIIGFSLLGVVGGIIAVPVAGCLRVLLLDYLENRKTNKVAPKDLDTIDLEEA